MDPDGGGVRPLKIHKLYEFLLKIAFGSPTLEKAGPPGKWWIPWINDGTPPETWEK